MSRKLVYLNGQNETITFETGPYLIVKIEGLGIPNVDRQEQKAPYQDGTTYIDSLLQNRDIVVELAITKPNDFSNIALYRRELSQRLTPKYGLGDLTYTDEDGNSYTIRAVVSSMVFPNKDYRDPYMRAMVTFTACDPYWRGTDETEIILPTSATNGENVINAGKTADQSVIERSDGSLFIAYRTIPGNYLISRTYTTSWSAESVINAEGSASPSVIERSDGSLFIVYTRISDNYLVSRTYTTSWSAESVINAEVSYYASVIERSDGSLLIVYVRIADNYLISRTYTTSWSAESVINAEGSSTPSVIERSDGSLLIAYVRIADDYLISRTYTTSWSTESVINAEGSASPSVIERSDGSLLIVYTRFSDDYLVSATRSTTPVPIVNIGDVPAPFLARFQGPSTNPRIINQNTLEYIRLNTTLSAADSFEVDTSFGNKTVKLIQGGIEKNGIAFLDIGSTFFQIPRPTLPSLPVGVNPYRGLKAYWSMDNVPEIPDDPAGVTYLQDAWATVDGWSGFNCSTSYANGELIATGTAGGTQVIFRVVPSYLGKTIRVKVRNPGSYNILWYDGTGYAPMTYLYSDGIYQIWQITNTVTSQESINIASSGGSIGYIWAIDWVYIGTGAYLPNSLIDNSGNGNHGRIYGATPVDGISGKALAFDGVNDYCSVSGLSEYFGVGRVVAVCGWFTPKTSSGTQMFSYPDSGNNNRFYISILNASVVNFSVNNNISIAIPLATNERAFLVCIRDNITGILYAYKNGVLVGQSASTAPVASGSLSVFLGSINATGGYANCEIDEPRIYNRALSAEEVKYLYDNPGIPIPADATVIYYEDDAVLSTAVATLEFTERYSGL